MRECEENILLNKAIIATTPTSYANRLCTKSTTQRCLFHGGMQAKLYESGNP
jgi:hypothetical protein